MEKCEKKRGGWGCAIWAGATLLILGLLLYVLSVGPVVAMFTGKPVPAKSLNGIYEPLGVVARNCEPVNKALTWYIELWTK